MKDRDPRKSALLLLCFVVAFGGCSHTAPKAASATFDGDLRLASEAKDFFIQHRVLTLNGHDLYDRHNARARDEKISCLLRDCKLQPGEHTIVLEYRWDFVEVENSKKRTEALNSFFSILGMFVGVGGSWPDSPIYPCQVSISFEAQPALDYILNIVHTDRTEVCQLEVQVVESESRVVVGSSSPSY
jgi:hypothetical protein